MSKKIVIVGPPGAGKTTLRKIFFEGENSSYLLDYALEPTHGKESLILNLKEKVGIFDLAGQENKRWFDTDEKFIFKNTKIILVVIDITTHLKTILNFIKKIIEIRNTLTPHSMIYVLLHKIDLINSKKLNVIKSSVNKALLREKLIKILFSSVKEEFFTYTFSFFIEILNTCFQDESPTEHFDFILLNDMIRFLHLIDKELVASKKDLKEKLNITEENLNHIIELLELKGQIHLSPINDEKILSLTEKGKNNFNKIVNNFSLNNILPLENEVLASEIPKDTNIPPILGYFISNIDGLTLLKVELYEGVLLRYLKNKVITEKNIEEDKFDIELIPMFISALEKFSQEINIQDLNGFSLLGTNLKMQIFGFDQFTVTLFSNPNANIKHIEFKIRNYFIELFKTYGIEFGKAIQTGLFSDIVFLEKLGADWLQELNNSYEHTIIDLNFFDFESANNLYKSLDDFQEDVNLEYSIILEKIKGLKINLTNAILAEEFEAVKKLAKITSDLKLNFMSKIN